MAIYHSFDKYAQWYKERTVVSLLHGEVRDGIMFEN